MIKPALRVLVSWLTRLTYEKHTLDKVNQKLIRAVDGLVIDGKQYYEFVNTADMPDARYIHYINFHQEFAMGIDRNTFIKYCREIRKANDSGEKSRIGSLVYMLEDTLTNCTPVESMYNLASLLYFNKEEDLTCWDGDYNTEKIKQFKKLPNQTFFLARLSEQSLRIPGEMLPENISDYLAKSQVKLKAFDQILSAKSE